VRQRLKLERERFAAENEEKALIKLQLEAHKKQMKEIQDPACSKKEEYDVEYFRGFNKDEINSRLNVRIMLNQIVHEEEEAVANLESLKRQETRRELLNKLICKLRVKDRYRQTDSQGYVSSNDMICLL